MFYSCACVYMRLYLATRQSNGAELNLSHEKKFNFFSIPHTFNIVFVVILWYVLAFFLFFFLYFFRCRLNSILLAGCVSYIDCVCVCCFCCYWYCNDIAFCSSPNTSHGLCVQTKLIRVYWKLRA